MDAWNPGNNRWRYKNGSDEKIIEIELTQGKVAQIDAHRLEEVQKYRWWAVKTQNNTDVYYAKSEVYNPKEGEPKTPFMHVMLFPDIRPPRDHIDRDGLNNVASNIRCGLNGINSRNVGTKKANMGITEQSRFQRFRAIWREKDGRSVEKLFTWSKYSNKDAAYAAAVACRKENADRVVKELEELNATNPNNKPERYVKRKQAPKSGLRNILIRDEGTRSHRVEVAIEINKKRFTKSFSLNAHNDDIDDALEAAKEWLEKIKTENPKKRKIDDE